MFAVKARAYPRGGLERYFTLRTLAFPTNIRLGWKSYYKHFILLQTFVSYGRINVNNICPWKKV
jgi:hypothetical protein